MEWNFKENSVVQELTGMLYLAGKVTVKGAGGHAGVLDNLPQRSALKPLVQKFSQRGLFDVLQCGGGSLFHFAAPHNNTVI